MSSRANGTMTLFSTSRSALGVESGEDGLLGHITGRYGFEPLLMMSWWLVSISSAFCGFEPMTIWFLQEGHALHTPPLPFLTSLTVTSRAPSVAIINILTVHGMHGIVYMGYVEYLDTWNTHGIHGVQ